MVDECLNPVDAGHFEDISVEVIGRANTVLITDRFPIPNRPHSEDGLARVWLTVGEARGLRDWLNKALPASSEETPVGCTKNNSCQFQSNTQLICEYCRVKFFEQQESTVLARQIEIAKQQLAETPAEVRGDSGTPPTGVLTPVDSLQAAPNDPQEVYATCLSCGDREVMRGFARTCCAEGKRVDQCLGLPTLNRGVNHD
jgi:hypothetical protein